MHSANFQETEVTYKCAFYFKTIIEKSLNITTIISTPPDNNWGSQNENGSWNGMVGGILESRIDVVLASLYKSPTRGEVIDFSATIDEIVKRMFIKFP